MKDEQTTGMSADAVGAPYASAYCGLKAEEQELLEKAREVGENTLGPNAQISDQMDAPDPKNFKALAEAGLMGLTIPQKYGGWDASSGAQWECQRILAEYCGVTTFTQAQHHGPSRMIADCPNDALKQRLLPDLAKGVSKIGVSFAHLRRPGNPILRAELVEDGYRLYGKAPWVTGWGLISQLAIGATLPDGSFVYLWSPVNRDSFSDLFVQIAPPDNDWGEMRASEPMKLSAMNASATVELELNGWYIPKEHWLLESNREKMRLSDRNGVLFAAAMPMGCAAASIRLMRTAAEKRGIALINRTAEALEREWRDAKQQIVDWCERTSEETFFENAIKIRAWAIELAARCAHAAVAANSGAANSLSHPAQRLYREAMFYTVQAQTLEVMDATLLRLERTNG